MKKLFFPLMFALISAPSFAQISNSVVQVEKEISGTDTLRTFFLDSKLCDMFITKMTALHGQPEGANTGSMKFSGVNIPGIGQNLKIVLNDGAMIYANNTWSHSTFLNPADAEAKMSQDPARMRRMFITVKAGAQNPVNTLLEENAMISFSENLMFN